MQCFIAERQSDPYYLGAIRKIADGIIMNDQTITVYNYHKNQDKTETWQRTVINGVSYRYTTEHTVSSTGTVVLTQVLTAVIPTEATSSNDRQYIDAVEYARLADTSGNWTINQKDKMDYIVAGEYTQEISASYKVSQLKADHQKSGIVKGFTDNTDEMFLKHYKVVAI